MSIKVYVAARFSKLAELRDCTVPYLECFGYESTSTWLKEDPENGSIVDKDKEAFFKECALTDLDDIERADIFMLFSEDPESLHPRGGRHVETGYAIGLNKRVVVIGPKENIFHMIPQVEVYESIPIFLMEEMVNVA